MWERKTALKRNGRPADCWEDIGYIFSTGKAVNLNVYVHTILNRSKLIPSLIAKKHRGWVMAHLYRDDILFLRMSVWLFDGT